MGNGYTRQSSASIVNGLDITAPPLNAEFNAVQAAFNASTGHTHDGSAGEGPPIPLGTSVSGILPVANGGTGGINNLTATSNPTVNDDSGSDYAVGSVWVNITTDRVWICADASVGTAVWAEVLLVKSNAVLPDTTATVDLGATGTRYKDLYLSGIINSSSGTSVFDNVTINGTLDMNSSTSSTITGLSAPSGTTDAATKGYVDTADSAKLNLSGGTMSGNIDMGTNRVTNLGTPTVSSDAATKTYVDTAIANLIASAPGTLDTLNELAAALGNDANFATTVTNSLATKLNLSGGTMSGDIDMGTNKVTNLGTPSAGTDAVTKTYADTKLALSGGTMSGALDMGSTNKVVNLAAPTAAGDATNKNYVDGILGSATSAAASAASAAASFDSFDDRYLGAKSSDPTLDNDGDPLLTGALYFNTVSDEMRVYTGSTWKAAGSAVNGTSERRTYTATSGQTTFNVTYDVGFVDVWLNGVKLLAGTDFTATNGTSIVLASGATNGDIVDIIAFGAFSVSNTVAPARQIIAGTGLTGGGDLSVDRTLNVNVGTGANQIVQLDGSGALPAVSGANLTGIAGAGLVLLSTQTVTAPVATVDFTTGIDSTYDEYVFMYYDVLPSTDGAGLIVRYSTDGGSTFSTGNAIGIRLAGSTTVFGVYQNNESFLAFDVGNAAGENGASGSLRIFRPSVAQKVRGIVDSVWHNASSGLISVLRSAVDSDNSTDFDAIQFLFQAGNISSGTFRLYGVRKS